MQNHWCPNFSSYQLHNQWNCLKHSTIRYLSPTPPPFHSLYAPFYFEYWLCFFERVMDNKKMNPRRDVESGRTKNNCSYVYVAETHRESCSWLVPAFVFVNIVVFIVVMGINNCPNTTFGFHKHHHHCVARFLHRFSFQPFRENPLLGPSSLT